MSDNDFPSFVDLSFIKGRVIDVIPISVNEDSGGIWEQDILFQLDSGGITIPLSDNDVEIKKEDIGHEKNIQMMTAFRISIEKCSGNMELGISLNPVNPGHSPKIRGIIRKIVEPSEEKYKHFRRYATLDIGIGQILLVLFKNHKEDFSIFHEGDCVSFIGRLDVLKVK